MPWCPKCKNEYKEGYTVCADCGCELVDSLDEAPVAVYFGSEEEIDGILTFLQVNHIADVDKRFDENVYEIVTSKKNCDQVKKAISLYLKEIASSCTDEATKEAVSQKYRETKRYEDTSKRATEYKTGAYTLLFVGLLGIIVLVLMNVGVFPIALAGISRVLITGVMGALFVIFIVLGIGSMKTCKNLEKQTEDENETKKDIENWAKDYLTADDIDSRLVLKDLSDEEKYFVRTELMKQKMTEYKPDLKEEFVDYLVEKFYSKLYEN